MIKKISLFITVGIVAFITAKFIVPIFTKQGREMDYTEKFINEHSHSLKSKYNCIKQLSFFTGGGINIVIDDITKEKEVFNEVRKLNYNLEILIHKPPNLQH
jgi:hypothetical protein